MKKLPLMKHPLMVSIFAAKDAFRRRDYETVREAVVASWRLARGPEFKDVREPLYWAHVHAGVRCPRNTHFYLTKARWAARDALRATCS